MFREKKEERIANLQTEVIYLRKKYGTTVTEAFLDGIEFAIKYIEGMIVEPLVKACDWKEEEGMRKP